jgi:hypothetical protein
MNVLVTKCLGCKKITVIPGIDPLADLSHMKASDPIGVICLQCGHRYSTIFSECYLMPNEVSAPSK